MAIDKLKALRRPFIGKTLNRDFIVSSKVMVRKGNNLGE